MCLKIQLTFNIENLLQPDKDQVPTNLNTSLPRTEKGYLHGSTDNPAKKKIASKQQNAPQPTAAALLISADYPK